MTKIFPFLLSALLILSSCEPNPTDTSSSADTSSTTDSSSQTETSSDPAIIYEDYYNDYYDSIESWENGEDLREQLNELINFNVTLVEFDGSNRWAVNQKADETFDNFDRVNLVYANYQPLKSYTFTGSNQGWQREHAFAQTLGNFDANNTRPESEATLVNQMRSDFHNLFASDGRLNNSRGNKNLGNVTEEMGTIVYPTDYFGNETGCRAIQSVENVGVNVFEPRPQDKPMMARGIFSWQLASMTSMSSKEFLNRAVKHTACSATYVSGPMAKSRAANTSTISAFILFKRIATLMSIFQS